MRTIIVPFVLALACSGLSTPDIENSPDGDIIIRIPTDEIGEKLKEDEPVGESGVYWRDWRKKIPPDAVIGGYTKSDCGTDVPIYMAQVDISDQKSETGLQPVSIRGRFKYVKATSKGNQYETNQHIKILCVDDPDILTWVHVSKTKDHELDVDCVVAGHELESNILFGRTIYDEETIIGKALPARNIMYFPYMGKEKNVNNFEVLCYKTVNTRKRRSENSEPKMDQEISKRDNSNIPQQENPYQLRGRTIVYQGRTVVVNPYL